MSSVASTILGVIVSVANSFIPLTSPTHALSIPNLNFKPYSHISRSSASPIGYTPIQIRHAYGLDQLGSQGAGHSVAIVDAYSDSHLGSDLQTFISTYRLPEMNGLPGQPKCTIKAGPHPCLEVVNQASSSSTGWSTETALDTQWAHAIANQSDMLVVEAKDSSAKSFAAALTTTMTYKPTTVSLSWGGSEFTRETDWDTTFNQSTVVAASGDEGYGASFPSTSPNVLSVGGTTLTLDASGKRIGTEAAWSGSGGGESLYQGRPTWQAKDLLGAVLNLRLTPDISYNADPATGYSVYDGSKWEVVGGTSAAAPQVAAMLGLATKVPSNSKLYAYGTSTNRAQFFNDITHGSNGTCKFFCETRPGYDSVTGLGSPIGNQLIPSVSL